MDLKSTVMSNATNIPDLEDNGNGFEVSVVNTLDPLRLSFYWQHCRPYLTEQNEAISMPPEFTLARTAL